MIRVVNNIQPIPYYGGMGKTMGDLEYLAKHWKKDLAKHSNELKIWGWVEHEVFRAGKSLGLIKEPRHNLFTTEGMNQVLDIIFGTGSAETTYVSIFHANDTPVEGDTAAACCGTSEDYSTTPHAATGGYDACDNGDATPTTPSQPVYKVAAAASGAVTNSANKAHYVMDDTLTIYGAYISNIQDSTSSSGKLYCAKQFTASRAVVADDELYVTYTVTLSN